MESKNLVGMVVAITVALICTASIMVPVLNESMQTEKTFTNDGLWRMAPFEIGDTWARSESGEWTLNGDAVIDSDNSNSSVILSDDWTVRGSGMYYGHTVYNNSSPTTIVIAGNGTATINGTEVTATDGYGVDSNGSYIMTDYAKPVYVNGDSPIYATGYSTVNGVGFVVHIEATVDDGATVTCYTLNNTTAASNFQVTDLKVNAEAVYGYEDLYKLSSITFTVTLDYTTGGTTSVKTGAVSYSSYVTEYQVTAEKSVHFDAAGIALIAVIPVLVIVGILMIAVRAVNRD